ncbi:MAG: hypothetical protein PHX33_06875, partial [Candidatus Cloacimonetes bacterium]|nr:hypothetical protein [Candidatus Cloacimonadota bacterium]
NLTGDRDNTLDLICCMGLGKALRTNLSNSEKERVYLHRESSILATILRSDNPKTCRCAKPQ